MSELERAILIATEAHNDQKDKGGQPYILHPLRVMATMGTADERIVAVLHDVAEDCPWWPVDKLADEFGPAIGAALDAITKRKGEEYDAYLDRVAANPIARAVKLSDLADNIDLSRLGRVVTDDDRKRLGKYQRAREKLWSHGSDDAPPL